MIGSLASLALAGLIFAGSHVLISSTKLRGMLCHALGEGGYLGLYSALAVVSLAWFVAAFAWAPVVSVWTPPLFLDYLPVALMPLASVLLVCGLTTRNPTAVGQERRARADNPAPGILRVTRHPVMWAFGLWGASHLAVNGDAAAMIFFG